MRSGMGEVTVRTATQPDVPGWLESSAALFAEDAGTRDPTMNVRFPYEEGVEGHAQLPAEPDRLVLVADAEGEIVGHLTGQVEDPTAVRQVRVATLRSLYVGPAYRSHGVGADFVAAFRAWGRRAGRGPDRGHGVREQRWGSPVLQTAGIRPVHAHGGDRALSSESCW